MAQAKWDRRFLDLAKHISTWSKDPSTKCGAVITDTKNRIVSLGYNGYPRGVDDSNYHDRNLKYEKVIHAETNAILFADWGKVYNSTLYVYPMPPCSRCMTNIIQSGIKRIVTIEISKRKAERWAISNSIGFKMAKEVGLKIDFYVV